jgi:hypothetical protein
VKKVEMQRQPSVDGTAHNVEVFCLMILEEFMTTRNMHATLRAFRKEWDRPNEVSHTGLAEGVEKLLHGYSHFRTPKLQDITMFSWYNLILKLQMAEHLHQDESDENNTVLESLVKALIKGGSQIFELLGYYVYFRYTRIFLTNSATLTDNRVINPHATAY